MFIETGEYEVQFSNKKCRKFVEDMNFHYIHWGLIGVYLKTREKKKNLNPHPASKNCNRLHHCYEREYRENQTDIRIARYGLSCPVRPDP
jgi:hypothetical protein